MAARVDAYKQWLCATSLTYYINGQVVPPCSTFCQQVEAMCPFFRPKVDTHEGDPSFICKDREIEWGPSSEDGDVTSTCFQMCHVMGPADIRRTYCHSNRLRCRDLRHELEECPTLEVNVSVQEDNSTGSHVNATSAATGSVHIFSGHLTRTVASAVVVIVADGARGEVGRDPGAVFRLKVAAVLSLLWMALTSYTDSCRGLT